MSSFSRIFRKIAKFQGLKAANKTIAQLTGQKTEEQKQEEKRNAEAEQAAKVLANASAITSNGRTTPTVNNTTNAPATSETINDGLLEYVGDVRARASRRKRGAPMANGNGTLGQPTILGV